MGMKTYEELIKISDYYDRIRYLFIGGAIAEETFGSRRWLNQVLYSSDAWKKTRRDIIIRDSGCDLAHVDHPLGNYMTIHHIDPITIEDIENHADKIFDPSNLITVSSGTHRLIHYGRIEDIDTLALLSVERAPGDTKLW